MRGYPDELRRRVISFVEAGGSRSDPAEQFDIGVSSALWWTKSSPGQAGRDRSVGSMLS